MIRGGLVLRGPNNRGWWDVAYQKSSKDRPAFYSGLLHGDSFHSEPDGTPWTSSAVCTARASCSRSVRSRSP